jgi:hypothetical protein
LKYLDGSIVSNSLYRVNKGVIFDFSQALSDTTMYCEMRNSMFPGLILKTVNFNTVPPMRYNHNDSANLRAFLEQPSKQSGASNGQYLSSGYNADDASTYPVKWIAMDPEYRLVRID